MALMPGQAKETMRMETTAKRPSYESILLEGEAKGVDVSYFDGMVVSQFQAEPTYEKKVVPRKFQEARRARADRYYKALSLFLFFCTDFNCRSSLRTFASARLSRSSSLTLSTN